MPSGSERLGSYCPKHGLTATGHSLRCYVARFDYCRCLGYMVAFFRQLGTKAGSPNTSVMRQPLRFAGCHLCSASPQVAITVRRFGKRSFSPDDLVKLGSLPETVKNEAERLLRSRRNILVSGGTGSGKTTLLNALIELLPDDERIVAIEDTLELRIERANCVRFEARGLQEGAVTIRDLVRHALRHRPDHIVVGEVRGGEAADLLQALNTGHGGSLTTVHANNAESALSRIASWRHAG